MINEKGIAKSKEFLGFSGTDCEAIIDLIKPDTISKVVVHGLRQEGSWIWQPQTLEVFVPDDAGEWKSLGTTSEFAGKTNGTMTFSFKSVKTQTVKVLIKNWGQIPKENPGLETKPGYLLMKLR
ncbi:MAG: hypothetical protein IPH18_03380 [Chitinophagaceae bacterium]|nr:hypothetical protein [Chitinophagaceae bacterium]